MIPVGLLPAGSGNSSTAKAAAAVTEYVNTASAEANSERIKDRFTDTSLRPCERRAR
jgi:hypothetical protein